MLRAAPVAALVTVTLAARTAKPCGSVTVPDSVAVLTCAALRTAQLRTSTQRIIAHTPSLRRMFPPRWYPVSLRSKFPLPLAAAESPAVLLDRINWIQCFYCNKQMLSIENLAAGTGE